MPHTAVGAAPSWLLLEHVALTFFVVACISLLVALRRTRPELLLVEMTCGVRGSKTKTKAPAVLAALAQLEAAKRMKSLAGPMEVLSWPDVYEAPAASMELSGLLDGEVRGTNPYELKRRHRPAKCAVRV